MNGTTPALLKAQSSSPKRSIVAATSFSTPVRDQHRFAAEIEEITVGWTPSLPPFS